MTREWVVDASPLIVLGRIGRLDLIPTISPNFVIPEAVAQELSNGRRDDGARRWIKGEGARHVTDTIAIDPRIAAWDLGAGESEVLSHVISKIVSEAVIDDRAARNCASAVGVRVCGTLGVIIIAKRQGIITKVGPILEELMNVGLYIDSRLVECALKLVGEKD